ncbi:aldolase [Roseospira marina]|uniref:3-oxo-tetronate 4-phosphate decarboxylase n=1 Tax=Roseospira marina TaxID=140057 RepID=A0A5M6I8J7_9PROT|nr:aldolase [Roseospira marina]KAA5604257.1 aldolase [Roseospira marina]MBB4315593.1 ribulose-5-phosphate 4-epimerase/fuculose-1-phosphate aldolase [Roseospira marina]MBB5088589.1 ribulose-5-phosphate 4-epimerase/fuculose-1-phosphate aldolase [Roseospira marina]
MSIGAYRERMCALGCSLFDRGLVAGGAGNISVRTAKDRILITPTGGNFGRMGPDDISEVDADGALLTGAKPSKELPFHLSLYRARPKTGAIVHLHSTYLTALACRQDLDYENALRPFTPYYVMRAGSLPVVPYYRPGDPRIGEDLEALARKTDARAFLLASHGPVVLGDTLEQAVDNAEELEETAKLAFLLRGERIRYLTDAEIAELRP